MGFPLVGYWVALCGNPLSCLENNDIDYLEPESINGLNLYVYCKNDPINMVDPSGNFSLPNWAKWLIGGITFAGAVALTYLTGGALAPVFIGMVGSILLDGVVEGVIFSTNGGSLWEEFVDGAANGTMWVESFH